MLGKLLKYDLKAEYKTYGILYIVLILTSFLSLITSKILDNYPKNIVVEVFELIQKLSIAGIPVLSFAIFIVTLVFSINRFYKNLLKDEGYLMHTLPVSTSQLILSKFIAFFIWSIAAVAVVFLAMSIAAGGFEWINIFAQGYSKGFAGVNQQDFIKFNIYLIIFIVLTPLAFMSHVYLSFAIGQLSSKNKLGMSVLTFVVIYFVEQIVSTIITLLLPNSNVSFEYNSDIGPTAETIEAFSKLTDYMLIGVIITLLVAAAMYIVSNVILTKKLNLE